MSSNRKYTLAFLLSLCLTATLALFFLHGKSGKAGVPRLVLLYATCSLNKDYLGAYNSDVKYTPNIVQFTSESIIFAKHETESPFSGAAYAALFSGTQAYQHGIYYQPDSLKQESYLIAEAFRDNQFETFSWHGKSMAAPELNYAQGIQPQNVFRASPADDITLTEKDQNFVRILNHLKSDKDYRAFVQISFSMTHAPYSGNSSVQRTASFCKSFPQDCNGVSLEDLNRFIPLYAKNHIRMQFHFDETAQALNLTPPEINKLADVMNATYKSSVNRLDAAFGRTLQAIRTAGLMNESLIVFTSDHGEVLYRKNSEVKWFHGRLEPEVVNIPLIIRLPAGPSKQRVYSAVTRSIDVFPTIAGLSHMKIRPGISLDGVDLSSYVIGSRPPQNLIAYSCSELPHPAVAPINPKNLIVQARQGDTIFRLVQVVGVGPKLKVFDLSKDRFLTKDLFDPSSQLHMEMEKRLQTYRMRLIASFDESTDKSKWEEERERLRSLGYIN